MASRAFSGLRFAAVDTVLASDGRTHCSLQAALVSPAAARVSEVKENDSIFAVLAMFFG